MFLHGEKWGIPTPECSYYKQTIGMGGFYNVIQSVLVKNQPLGGVTECTINDKPPDGVINNKPPEGVIECTINNKPLVRAIILSFREIRYYQGTQNKCLFTAGREFSENWLKKQRKIC